MGMQITLTREAAGEVVVGDRYVWPLKVTATSPDGVPHKIFVYHAAAPYSATGEDVFECIASISQLDEIPEDEPSLVPDENGEVVPYYRSDVLELNCRSANEANDIWEEIQLETDNFIDNWAAWQQLGTSETANFYGSYG